MEKKGRRWNEAIFIGVLMTHGVPNRLTCMKSNGISHQILIYNHTLALEHNIEARNYLLFP